MSVQFTKIRIQDVQFRETEIINTTRHMVRLRVFSRHCTCPNIRRANHNESEVSLSNEKLDTNGWLKLEQSRRSLPLLLQC